jgi:hypothetical protein
MGRSITPKYRVETITNSGRLTPFPWSGLVSQKRLEDWRATMNKSFSAGGVNFHVSEALGVIYHISEATIVRQSDGRVMCAVKAPLFEVL